MRETYLSARAALRRNYQDLLFCPQDDKESLEESMRRSLKRLQNQREDFILYRASDPGRAYTLFIERGILPSAFHKLTAAALLANEEDGLYAAINVEEHLLLLALGEVSEIEQMTEKVRALEAQMTLKEHPFAQNDRFDYLSYRPVLAGSGLYVSILLHLPMLGFLKQTRSLCETVLQEYHCQLKPYPETDSRNPGKLFLIANAGSQGISDSEIKQQVISAAEMLDRREAALREKVVTKERESSFSDQIWRSYGTLRYARRLTSRDFLLQWSNLRLGAAAGALPVSLNKADDLLALSGDSIFLKDDPDPKTLPFRRADAVRKMIAGG